MNLFIATAVVLQLRFSRFLSMAVVFSLLSLSSCGGGGNSSGGGNPPNPTPQAATPTFSVARGTYSSDQSVTISCTTSGANIYYTTDGSTPTSSSTHYTSAVAINSSTSLKAIATASGYTNSAVASATYTLKVAAPAITPAAGTYASTQTVTISTTTSGASIHYTTDGSIPTASSTTYTAPISVSSSLTVKAIATRTGYSDSDVSSNSYTISTGTPSYTFKSVKIVGGGFVTGINFHPSQPNLIYTRTDVGGAYRWENTNQAWIPLMDWVSYDDSGLNGVEAIGLDPSDPQRLYIAGGIYSKDWQGNAVYGKMLVSTDQGKTFQVIPTSIPMGGNEDGRSAGNRFAVDPNYGQKLYYGSINTGLWTSNDHGSTWTKVAGFPVTGRTNGNGIVFVEFVKSSGTAGSPTPVIYAGVADTTGTYSRVYRSTNSGSTWTAVPNQPSGLASLFPNHGAFGPDGALYMSFANGIGPNGASTGAIWKYTPTAGDPNGAGTWTDITPPKLPYDGYNQLPAWGSVAVDAQRPGVVMASTIDLWWHHDGIVRSTDGGKTWIDLGETAVRDNSLAPFTDAGGPGNWINLAIDPFNSDRVFYGWGGGIWASNDVTVSEPGTANAGFQVLKGGVTHWTTGADGIEEGATIKLVSPPAGAHLITAMGDFKGFVHTDLTQSPAGGAEPPVWGSSRGLDFAQAAPLVIVRTGDRDRMPWGSYTTDGGTTWTGFSSAPTSSSGGTIAVSADGSRFVWSAQIVDANWNVIGGKVAYSTDHGATWIASAGAPVNREVFSDRVNKNKFYILDASTTTLYRSTDGGASFTAVNTTVPTSSWYWPTMTVSYAAEGDLWLVSDTGLYRSTDSGANFSKVSTVQAAYSVGFGMAAPGQSYPAVYLSGQVNNVKGLFRSTDAGGTWIRINDDQHQYGGIGSVTGDPRIFGRVYFGGRGVMYGDSAN